MTHRMTPENKEELLKEIKHFTSNDILQREDADEIYRVIYKACWRTLASIDDPRPVESGD